MGDETARQRRGGWGLPRRGSTPAAGASWEGEGRQPRPEPPRRGRSWRGPLVVAVGVLLGGGALWVGSQREDEVSPPGEDPVAQEAAQVGPGTCLATLPSDTATPLDVVPCEQQHLGEVVAVLELDEGAWPGETAVLVQARDRCADAFVEHVGVADSDSELNLQPVVPRENDWRIDGDRTVVCLAEGPALIGSVQGSGR